MPLFHGEEENYSVSRFESMLNENNIYYFDIEEFEEIIDYYLEWGKMNKAKRALEIGLNQHPSASSLKLLHVEVLIFEDELQHASELIAQLEHVEPSNSEVFVQKANLYSKLNQHHKAIETLQYAVSLTDDLVDVYSLIAMEYLFVEDYPKAIQYFKMCLDQDVQDYMSLQQLLFCYDMLGQNDEAISYLNGYLNKNPYCEVAWHYLGKQYTIKKDFTEAIRCFDFAIISDDTFAGAYFEKAKVLEKIGEYDKAIENYKITLTLDDASPLVYLHIGKCYEKKTNDHAAEKYYLKAVHEDPQLSKSWFTLADFYHLRGMHSKAVSYIYKAVHIEDDNPFYWKRFAEINLSLNDNERATYALQRAVQSGDYSLDTLVAWTDMLLLRGDYARATFVIDDIRRFFPDENATYWRLAIVSAGNGNMIATEKYLRKANEIAKEWLPFFDKKFTEFFRNEFIRNILK
ncbi:MAG: tetratricopeptide repeat protein [Capnocytophaga sp.]|nr:tetratricopeptide repeat protein [Capnocytophaga sp.]